MILSGACRPQTEYICTTSSFTDDQHWFGVLSCDHEMKKKSSLNVTVFAYYWARPRVASPSGQKRVSLRPRVVVRSVKSSSRASSGDKFRLFGLFHLKLPLLGYRIKAQIEFLYGHHRLVRATLTLTKTNKDQKHFKAQIKIPKSEDEMKTCLSFLETHIDKVEPVNVRKYHNMLETAMTENLRIENSTEPKRFKFSDNTKK
ncbi:hypothetical protein EVAR_84522_1 [Eumeta japonica]|uniref:Uncharacterized protein n=1 Tax=Eumeta variegata TaxID=151549 RepID=A0A4C1UHK3_EUMVA|nr:hypothetical protein EVAR_84522_1 [Eumeta japonica]